MSTPLIVCLTTPSPCLVGSFPILIRVRMPIATSRLIFSFLCFPIMVCVFELRDENLEFEGERPLDASFPSSSSLHLGSLLEGGLGLPFETSSISGLVMVVYVTSKVVARTRIVEIEKIEGVAQRKSSTTESEETVTDESGCDLDLSMSRVT